MGRLQKNQSGFGAVEAILILVITGLIGFTGWYVYHAQQSTNKALAPDTSTSPKFKNNSKKSSATKTTTPIDQTVDWTSYSSKAGKEESRGKMITSPNYVTRKTT